MDVVWIDGYASMATSTKTARAYVIGTYLAQMSKVDPN